MADERTPSDVERQKARALARWEGEGGALGRSAKAHETLDDTDVRILTRFGRRLDRERSSLRSCAD